MSTVEGGRIDRTGVSALTYRRRKIDDERAESRDDVGAGPAAPGFASSETERRADRDHFVNFESVRLLGELNNSPA